MLRQISQKRFYLCKDVFGSTVIMFWGIDSVEGNAYPLNLVFLYGKGNLLLQSGRCWRTWWLPPSCFSTASHLLLVSHVFTWWWASLKTGHWETSASGFFFFGKPVLSDTLVLCSCMWKMVLNKLHSCRAGGTRSGFIWGEEYL